MQLLASTYMASLFIDCWRVKWTGWGSFEGGSAKDSLHVMQTSRASASWPLLCLLLSSFVEPATFGFWTPNVFWWLGHVIQQEYGWDCFGLIRAVHAFWGHNQAYIRANARRTGEYIFRHTTSPLMFCRGDWGICGPTSPGWGMVVIFDAVYWFHRPLDRPFWGHMIPSFTFFQIATLSAVVRRTLLPMWKML